MKWWPKNPGLREGPADPDEPGDTEFQVSKSIEDELLALSQEQFRRLEAELGLAVAMTGSAAERVDKKTKSMSAGGVLTDYGIGGATSHLLIEDPTTIRNIISGIAGVMLGNLVRKYIRFNPFETSGR